MDAPALYSALPPGWLRLEILGGLTLAYHRRAGTTHFLDAPVPEILACLDRDPASVQQVAERLAAAHGLTADAAMVAVVAARLTELAAIGLVTA